MLRLKADETSQRSDLLKKTSENRDVVYGIDSKMPRHCICHLLLQNSQCHRIPTHSSHLVLILHFAHLVEGFVFSYGHGVPVLEVHSLQITKISNVLMFVLHTQTKTSC